MRTLKLYDNDDQGILGEAEILKNRHQKLNLSAQQIQKQLLQMLIFVWPSRGEICDAGKDENQLRHGVLDRRPGPGVAYGMRSITGMLEIIDYGKVFTRLLDAELF